MFENLHINFGNVTFEDFLIKSEMASSEVRSGERRANSGFWTFAGRLQKRTEGTHSDPILLRSGDEAELRFPENTGTKRGK